MKDCDSKLYKGASAVDCVLICRDEEAHDQAEQWDTNLYHKFVSQIFVTNLCDALDSAEVVGRQRLKFFCFSHSVQYMKASS